MVQVIKPFGVSEWKVEIFVLMVVIKKYCLITIVLFYHFELYL